MKGAKHPSLPPELRDQIETPEARRKIAQVWGLLGRLERHALDAPSTEAAWIELHQRFQASSSMPRAATPDRHANQGRRSCGASRRALNIPGDEA